MTATIAKELNIAQKVIWNPLNIAGENKKLHV